MRGPGILWMLQTAAGLSMAGPMFVVGVNFLWDGRPVAGAGFLTLGALALYFPTYLLNRIGGPRAWIRRRLSRTRGDDAGDDGSRSDSDADASTGGSSVGLLERLRGR
ncbi:DUF7533 family protein [Haloterrigena alkaliphila]|uniref:Uncharacterized protein n=1 Tax=Haloterrigena alkaliphila TaxID=2816475 RepID=A0A8A2VI84_9EURY|nr:hypothetical protein [Haloterrigena alkaliphila]QSX00421.1 hypothetical protein J0X25_05485 [Haloterrigena alkaliphila]